MSSSTKTTGTTPFLLPSTPLSLPFKLSELSIFQHVQNMKKQGGNPAICFILMSVHPLHVAVLWKQRKCTFILFDKSVRQELLQLMCLETVNGLLYSSIWMLFLCMADMLALEVQLQDCYYLRYFYQPYSKMNAHYKSHIWTRQLILNMISLDFSLRICPECITAFRPFDHANAKLIDFNLLDSLHFTKLLLCLLVETQTERSRPLLILSV